MVKNSIVTKKDLKQALLPISKELKELRRETQLWKIESRETKTQVSMLDIRVRRLDEEVSLLRDELKGLSNKFLTFLDPVMGELKVIREELAAHSSSHERIQATLDEYDSRIKS